MGLITNSNKPYEEKLKELQLETLQERRENLSLRFANKCVKNARTELMFQKNIKKDNMSLRRKEKYSIPLARTVRLKKSAIPSTARHMNKNMKKIKKCLNYKLLLFRKITTKMKKRQLAFIIVPVNYSMLAPACAWLHSLSLLKQDQGDLGLKAIRLSS